MPTNSIFFVAGDFGDLILLDLLTATIFAKAGLNTLSFSFSWSLIVLIRTYQLLFCFYYFCSIRVLVVCRDNFSLWETLLLPNSFNSIFYDLSKYSIEAVEVANGLEVSRFNVYFFFSLFNRFGLFESSVPIWETPS